MRNNMHPASILLFAISFVCQYTNASAEGLRVSNFSEQISKLKNLIEFGENGEFFSSGEIIIATPPNSNIEKFSSLLSTSTILNTISRKINTKRKQDKIEIIIDGNIYENILKNKYKYYKPNDKKLIKNNLQCLYEIKTRKDSIFEGEKTGFIIIDEEMSPFNIEYCASKATLHFLGIRKNSIEALNINNYNKIGNILTTMSDTILAYAASECRNKVSKAKFRACIDEIIED